MKKPILFLLFTVFSLHTQAQNKAHESYLPIVLETEQWIRHASVDQKKGKSWLWCPDSLQLKDYQPTNLYHGTSGVVLFYVELYGATRDKAYLKEARLGADHLIERYPDTIPSAWEVGFYTGITGVSFALEQVYQASKKKKYRNYALKYLQLAMQSATSKGSGIEWEGINEVVYGSAGIGLYLLYAYKNMGFEPAKEWALQAGDGILANQQQEKQGISWLMAPGYEKHVMPNFSHGTAGVAYFLLRLYEVSGEKRFLEAALEGARYLENLIMDNGLIGRTFPSAKDIYYLGWCHGIAGTARLYYKLYELTSEEKWLQRIYEATQYTMTCGIPEQTTPGFWNNVSQCCGSAGLAQYYLEIYQKTNKPEYLDFAETLTLDLIRRSELSSQGRKWIQAENRTQADNLVAQTSYMQGSAGIGRWLLKFDAYRKRKKPTVRFPDNPFE